MPLIFGSATAGRIRHGDRVSHVSVSLMKLYADGGYRGRLFRRAVAKIMARLNVEIVKRSDHTKGFVDPAEALGGRSKRRMARAMQRLGQKVGKISTERRRISAPRFNQAHAENYAIHMISPDKL